MSQNFKKIYKDFFLKNDLILSSYFSFSWTTKGIGNFSKLIHIKQKLNKKLFIGIKKIDKNEIKFNKVLFLDSKTQQFDDIDFNLVIKREKEIEKFLKENLLKDSNLGFEISILTEAPRGYTLGFSGTLSALLISGISLFLEKINKEIFKENILEKKEIFEFLRIKSFELESIIKNGLTAGEASFMAFVNSANPILYHIGEDKKDYVGEDILKENYFPLNYLLIFSGLKVNTDRIEKQLKHNKEKLLKIEKYLLENFVFPKKSYLEKILKKSETFNNLNNVFVSLNSFTLYFLKRIIDFENKEDIRSFLENINNIRYTLKIFESQIDFADKFYSYFLNYKKYNNSNIGISSGTSQNAGGTFIVFYENREKSTIKNVISKIYKYYPDLEILFDSNKKLDKSEKYGINVEQFISKNIFGKYSNKKGVILKDDLGIKIIEYKDLDKLDYDILIDGIKNKIYINGKKLTSKDIHSQSIASEILIKLINSKNGEIKNDDMSYGSYRNNKIELNGKVILPLKKLILKNFNYNFPLSISGEIGDYIIKLGKHSLNIGVIYEIGQ